MINTSSVLDQYLFSPSQQHFPFFYIGIDIVFYKTRWQLCFRIRPYIVESTGSRPISKVKLLMARLVLWWETTWESLVLYFFVLFLLLYTLCNSFPCFPKLCWCFSQDQFVVVPWYSVDTCIVFAVVFFSIQNFFFLSVFFYMPRKTRFLQLCVSHLNLFELACLCYYTTILASEWILYCILYSNTSPVSFNSLNSLNSLNSPPNTTVSFNSLYNHSKSLPFPSTPPPHSKNQPLENPVSFNSPLPRWNVQRTNRKNKGLISADRNNKATLLLTIPRSTIVVCYGFILSNILYCYSEATKITLPCLGNPPCYDTRAETLFVIIWLGEGRNHRVLAWIPT